MHVAFEEDEVSYEDVFLPIHASLLVPSSLLADTSTMQRALIPPEQMQGASAAHLQGGHKTNLQCCCFVQRMSLSEM